MPKVNMNANKFLASLVSGQNISVVHKLGGQPAFNPTTKVMTVPVMDDSVGDDVYNTFIGSECGKVMHSPKSITVKGLPDPYVEILETARTERKIVGKYMGLGPIFQRGHQELLDRGFYGDEIFDENGSGMSPDMHLMDRINMFSKVGNDHGPIPFTKEEQVFMDRSMDTKTFSDVVELTRDIVKFLDEPPQGGEGEGEGEGDGEGEGEAQGSGSGSGGGQGEGDGDGQGNRDMSDNGQNYDDDQKDQSGGGGGSPPPKPEEKDDKGDGGGSGKDKPEDKPEDKEDDKADGKGDKPEDKEDDKGDDAKGEDDKDADKGDEDGKDADTGKEAGRDLKTKEPPKPKRTGPKDPNEMKTSKKFDKVNSTDASDMTRTTRNAAPIVSFDDYIKNTSANSGPEDIQFIEHYEEFVQKMNPLVQTMVNEFNVKKAAHARQKEGVSKTGKLDPLKLSQFKFTEELFKNHVIVPKQKSHGLIVLLDNSGSMNQTIPQLCEDIYILSEFCRRVDIPLEVYQFTDGHSGYKTGVTVQEGDLFYGGAVIVEVMNTKSNSQKYTLGRKYLAARAYDSGSRYHSSDTYCQRVRGTVWNRTHCTPLVEAYTMLFMVVQDFRERHQIEIMSTMILTDGMGNGALYKTDHHGSYQQLQGKSLLLEFAGYGVYHLNHQSYSGSRYGRQQGYETSVLQEIQGYSKVIGYFVGGDTGLTEEENEKHWQTKGYVEVDRIGHDAYFMLPDSMSYSDGATDDAGAQQQALQAKRSMVRRLAAELS